MSETSVDADWHNEFHQFGVQWEPGLVVWYVDGEEIRRLEGPDISRQSMYIIAYLVLGSEWAQTPDLTTEDEPVIYELDYVKVYQRSEFLHQTLNLTLNPTMEEASEQTTDFADR